MWLGDWVLGFGHRIWLARSQSNVNVSGDAPHVGQILVSTSGSKGEITPFCAHMDWCARSLRGWSGFISPPGTRPYFALLLFNSSLWLSWVSGLLILCLVILTLDYLFRDSDTHDFHIFPCNSIFVHFPSLYRWPLISTGLCAFALSGRTGNVTIRHIKTGALLHMLVLVLSAPTRAFGNCQEFSGVRIWSFATSLLFSQFCFN